MTVRRMDYWYGRRRMVTDVLYTVPLVAGLVVAVGPAQFEGWALFWAGLLLAYIGLGVALFTRRRNRGYRCPQCGTVISTPALKPLRAGRPVEYYCQDCDVLWFTESHVCEHSRAEPR